MAIIQPVSELMKHNYFHCPYPTQTENETYSERGQTGGVSVYYIYYTIYTVYSVYKGERLEGHGKEGMQRRHINEGWEKKHIIMHARQEIKVTYFRIN